MRNKRMIILVIVLIMVFAAVQTSVFAATTLPIAKGDTGDEVVRLQLRLMDLGYISFRPTGKYGDMTQAGVLAFQLNSELEKDGITGEVVWDTIFLPGAKRAGVSTEVVRVYGPGQTEPVTEFGEKAEWQTVKEELKIGYDFEIIDVNTSNSFKARRTGGENHAEIEPVTEADYEVYKTIFGGGYTWEKRAVIVVNGESRYAASLFGMPNANEVVANNGIEGSLDLYFSGSTSDFGGTYDVEHKNNILKAAGGV